MENKFIKKKTTRKTTKKQVEKPETKVIPVIKKGEFVECPKCGWKHAAGTTRCRFCGAKL